jgi:hypothetical protein
VRHPTPLRGLDFDTFCFCMLETALTEIIAVYYLVECMFHPVLFPPPHSLTSKCSVRKMDRPLSQASPE